ncbi:hypothetical protein [Candidatus Uabimicrobium sp. HlEnr_7]|uniref:hypothetical protein n=1 Tax=Candidatus Uabimicrobium helgolandensis TaxID=3095367 RepID=UPI00355628F3
MNKVDMQKKWKHEQRLAKPIEELGGIVHFCFEGKIKGVSFRPGAIKTSLAAAGNTHTPALRVLHKKGYTITEEEFSPCILHYIACKDKRIFHASSPVELLGIVSLWEYTQDSWQEAFSDLAYEDIVCEVGDKRRSVEEDLLHRKQDEIFNDEKLISVISHLKTFPELTVLDFADSNITDKGVELLSSFVKLEELCLSSTRITDKSLKTLGQFTNLRELYLDNVGISGAGLKFLRNCLQLRYLSLNKNGMSFFDLMELKEIEHLFQISVVGSKICEKQIEELKKEFLNLKYVELEYESYD